MPFLPLFTGLRHLAHVLTVPPTKACLLCATPAGMGLDIQVHARRLLPSAVPLISKARLLNIKSLFLHPTKTLCRKRLFLVCRRIGDYISLELF